MVRSVNAVIFLQAAAFFFSAPPTITVVNEMSGVSNFSAVLVYCILSAYACACRVLMENWREDVEVLPRTRRRVRRWIWGHGVVTILLIGCFVLGEAPVERQRDFETYYANTPFMREMVLLCLLAVTAAAAAAAAACWNWARDIRRECPQRKTPAGGLLRIGLTVLAVGFLTNVTYGVAKLAAVVAAWSGRDWEPLNRAAVSFACLGTLLIAVGFLIPIVGPWITARVFGPLWTLRSLGPLRRTLCRAGGPRGPVRLSTPWNAGPGRRLTDRMTDIHDRMLELGAYCSEGGTGGRLRPGPRGRQHGGRECRLRPGRHVHGRGGRPRPRDARRQGTRRGGGSGAAGRRSRVSRPFGRHLPGSSGLGRHASRGSCGSGRFPESGPAPLRAHVS